MAGYVEVTDADRRWAESSDNARIFRGPFGPVLSWIDSTIEQLRNQPPIKSVLMLCAAALSVMLVNLVIEDEHVSVLVRGGDACAIEKDLLEKSSHRCRVDDKLALGFLRGGKWVQCGEFSRGAQILMASKDSQDNFWYDVADKHKIAFFYSTCNPSCASATDDYRADLLSCEHGICDNGLCKVGDTKALTWLEGRKKGESWFSTASTSGFKCQENQRTKKGLGAIEMGSLTAFASNLVLHMEDQKPLGAPSDHFYDPKYAREVRALYSECTGPCACNDLFDDSTGLCSVVDQDVRVYFDATINNGQDLGPNWSRVASMNANCMASGGEIQMITHQGQLTGDYQHMTYLPGVKQQVRTLYSTCATHVPCP
mmetsp:Transcript_46798/g.95709  ORF Transcript_46798/g.95709 Transcript_46798/m.95709 type:complete len:370 (+) Transcript_46798:244-1353(+)